MTEQANKWNTFILEKQPEFIQLSPELIDNIEKNSYNINPIIHELFETLLKQCLNGFNFTDDQISYEKYMKFYQEINRIHPRIEKKIVFEDCYSTIFFIGDTHGAIHESFQIIDFFYKILQKDKNAKLIFVGDYVDRNPFDLENLTLITAFHILCPNNVILIRGNHEDRLINIHYGFIDNLLRTFWEKGEELYNEIIKVFTHLPIAHIAKIHSGENSAKVMTVHGGIPIDPHNFLEPAILEEIESKMICEVETSNDMDFYSVSMLWSDPDEMIQGVLTGEYLQGRMRFGYPIFEAFSKANEIDLVVRGHQKWENGYRIFFGGKLYSLFSTRTYDGKKRFEPKMLRVDFGKTPTLIPIESEDLNEEIKNYPNKNN